jgi:antitoxin component YwqK of YwqJK toxin-antitoxin module
VDGFLTGNYKVYFDNGQLDTESFLEKGTKNGGFTSYTREGKKILEGFYYNGQYHGEFKSYYPEGALKSKVLWVNGQKEGDAEYFYLNGSRKEKAAFVFDKKRKSKGWYEDGKPAFEKEFNEDEQPSGRWILYFPNGQPKEKLGYDKAGKRSGTRTTYDSLDYHKKTEEDWLHGLLTGKFKTFYPNGKTWQSFLYQGNYIQGLYQEWYPSGKLHVSGLYKNSKKTGKWEFVDEKGSQYKIETWRNGKLLGTKNIRFKKS